MSTLEQAIEIATEAHRGQRDKAGNDYIGHPLRVMAAGKTPEEKIVGVLHDVVEDSDWTLGDTISDEAAEEAFEDVEQRDFQQAVQAALAQLTDAQREAIIGEFWFGRKPDPKLRREALRVLRHPRIRKPLVEFYR